MTAAELAQHHEKQKRLNEARATYRELRLKAHPTPKLDGLPHGTDTGRKVEELGIVLADIAGQIEALQAEVAETLPAVYDFITGIDDGTTRNVFSLRVLCGLPWSRVGEYTNMEVETARKRYFRYLSKKS